MTNEDCDTVSFAGMTKLLVLCGCAKVSMRRPAGKSLLRVQCIEAGTSPIVF
jgi:hypothetical protein